MQNKYQNLFKSNEASCFVCVALFVCVQDTKVLSFFYCFQNLIVDNICLLGIVFFFVSKVGTVSNNFNVTGIIFDPQLQEVFDFKSKLPDKISLFLENILIQNLHLLKYIYMMHFSLRIQ